MARHPQTAPPLTLAPYAASDATSRGRLKAEPLPRYRGAYQRDRDRIVHSTAFRRLEYKTQVFVNHEGDLFRTRLTHSLEVAQIARSIARILQLNEDLTEAIALAHDLGHTPFGHAGQDALNSCMADFGGFEHNLQSLRVVDKLECRYAEFDGLNLTFEAREGILKHCPLRIARELGPLGERFLDKHQPTLEAQVTNLADEIAYNNHDVDDGIRAGLITLEQLLEITLFRTEFERVRDAYPDLDPKRTRHEIIRRMINRLVCDLVDASREQISAADPHHPDQVRTQAKPLICFSSKMRSDSLELKRFLREHLYRHEQVAHMTRKSARIIKLLFAAYMEDIHLLPAEHQHQARLWAQQHGDAGRARAVSDYIAGMTDRFAIAEHARLSHPETLP